MFTYLRPHEITENDLNIKTQLLQSFVVVITMTLSVEYYSASSYVWLYDLLLIMRDLIMLSMSNCQTTAGRLHCPCMVSSVRCPGSIPTSCETFTANKRTVCTVWKLVTLLTFSDIKLMSIIISLSFSYEREIIQRRRCAFNHRLQQTTISWHKVTDKVTAAANTDLIRPQTQWLSIHCWIMTMM